MKKLLKRLRLPRRINSVVAIVPAVAAFTLATFLFSAGMPPATAESNSAFAQSEDIRDGLRRSLNELTQEINALRDSLRDTRTQQRSLKQELDLLDKEIRRTELSLRRSEEALSGIGENIRNIEAAIAVYETSIAQARIVIGSFLQEIAERDDVPVVALFFTKATFADMTGELFAAERVQEELLENIAQLRDSERDLAIKKEALLEERSREEEVQQLLVAERDELRLKSEFRTRLLEETRGREQEFAEHLEATEENASRIRSELYLLADLGKSISFGEAYAIAKPLADKTGIRAAFLLAVLQKESRLGSLTGTGVWRRDMHPRDWPAFVTITEELGLDPDTTPVSRKPSYGWGGAMGPAQFLPSTWLGYRDRIAALTGHNPPSPWVIEDAFAAAALKLAAGGATQKTAEAEWRSAMQYFAGGNWRNPAYAFYGDAVEDLTIIFQRQVDVLEELQN